MAETRLIEGLGRRQVAAGGVAAALAAGVTLAAAARRPAPPGDEVWVREIARRDTTSSGMPIRLPSGPVDVVASTYDIPAGASLPIHRHRFPRFGYVLAGVLRVSNVESGVSHVFGAGGFISEDVGVWHRAHAEGRDPVRLLVIDLVERGATNVEKAPLTGPDYRLSQGVER